MKRIYLLFSLLIGCIYLHAAIYNVMDFGAKADGKTIDSPAINRAIEGFYDLKIAAWLKEQKMSRLRCKRLTFN